MFDGTEIRLRQLETVLLMQSSTHYDIAWLPIEISLVDFENQLAASTWLITRQSSTSSISWFYFDAVRCCRVRVRQNNQMTVIFILCQFRVTSNWNNLSIPGAVYWPSVAVPNVESLQEQLQDSVNHHPVPEERVTQPSQHDTLCLAQLYQHEQFRWACHYQTVW